MRSTEEATTPTGGKPLEQTIPDSARSGAALWHTRLVLVLLILGGLLRFNQLGMKGLWGDEIWTAQWSQPSLPQVLIRQTKPPDILPLMYGLVHISTRFGASEFWVRLPAAVSGVIGLALFYCLANLALGRRTALVGTVLMVVSPIHIWYSQDARYYTLLCALGIASLVFFYAFITSDKVRPAYWLGFVLVSAAALYTHIFAGWILLAEGAFAVWYLLGQVRRSGKDAQQMRRTAYIRVLWLLMALLCLALLTFPILHGLFEALQRGTSPGGEGMARLRLTPALPYFFTPAFFGEMVQFFSGGRTATLLTLPFFLVGLAAAWRRKRDVAVLMLCLMVVPFLTTLFLEFLHAIDFRYFLFLLPAYLLFVAQGFVTTAESLQRAVNTWRQRSGQASPPHAHQQPVTAATLAVLLLVALLAYIRPLKTAYAQAKINDWRAIAGYLANNVQPEDMVLMERWGAEALRYYLPPTSNVVILALNPERWQAAPFLGARTWLVGLGDQYEQQARNTFVKIDDQAWQDARWVYDRSQSDEIFYPATEFAAGIYVNANAATSPFVDFIDIDQAGWTEESHRDLAPGREAAMRLALEAMAPRVLRVRYFDHPGQNLEISVDGKPVGSVTGGSLGGWQTWQGQLPASARDSVRVAVAAVGTDHVGLDWVELGYATPPSAAVFAPGAPVDFTLDDQGVIDFDDIKNAGWTTETYRHLDPEDEIRVLLNVPDQAARILAITYYDQSGKSLEVRANEQMIGTITGGDRGGGWVEGRLIVPAGLGEKVLVRIQAIGSEASGVSSLAAHPIE